MVSFEPCCRATSAEAVNAVEGLGGGFQFCRLSADPLFDADGQIRPDVTFAQLADLVWFVETGSGYMGTADSPLLGIHEESFGDQPLASPRSASR